MHLDPNSEIASVVHIPAGSKFLESAKELFFWKWTQSLIGIQVQRKCLSPPASSRGQVPNTCGPWYQRPVRVWFSEPETLNIGYLDPLSTAWFGPRGS